MVRAKLWLQVFAMHDPVTPTLVRPALVGWEAKRRKVELTIERAFHRGRAVAPYEGMGHHRPAGSDQHQ